VCSLYDDIKKWWRKSKWSPLLIWFNIRNYTYKLEKEDHRGLKNTIDRLNSIILSIKILRGIKSLKRETKWNKTRFYNPTHRKKYTKIDQHDIKVAIAFKSTLTTQNLNVFTEV